jgi:uncharacterized membrane protein YkoI
MSQAFEAQLGILGVNEAIDFYQEKYPNSDLNKLQIEHEGLYLKYEMVGNDGKTRDTLEINAHTGAVLKERQKPLKEKHQDSIRRAGKALNLENLRPLQEINDLASEQIETGTAFQWELDRNKQRTVWKIEFADETGSNITEIKIDAQDGTIVQLKRKN